MIIMKYVMIDFNKWECVLSTLKGATGVIG